MEDQEFKVVVIGKPNINQIPKESMEVLCKLVLEAILKEKKNQTGNGGS